jgi:hypothetical protein
MGQIDERIVIEDNVESNGGDKPGYGPLTNGASLNERMRVSVKRSNRKTHFNAKKLLTKFPHLVLSFPHPAFEIPGPTHFSL